MHDELDYKKNFEFLDKAPGDAIHILPAHDTIPKVVHR